MYLEHFRLKARPFQLTPDSGFLFMSEAHRRAKAYMDYTVENREGFLVITGEIGCGKTTLIRKLLSELSENVVVARVFQTQLNEVEFLQAMLVEFGLNPFSAGKVQLLDMLNTYLVEQFHQGKQIVLIVDDAHNLEMRVLEEIRMLANLETQDTKILQVILVGQPQLDEKLSHPDMEQLLQRVKIRCHVCALAEQELPDYVGFRLRVAGAEERVLFLSESLDVVYRYAGGIPRLINVLCDTALTCAYADRLDQITPHVVETAATELRWPTYAERVATRDAKAGSPHSEGMPEEGSPDPGQSLAALARQFGRLDELLPALESINRNLGAIDERLHKLARRDGKVPSEPALGRLRRHR